MKNSDKHLFRINSRLSIDPEQIEYLKSSANYTNLISVSEEVYLHTKTLKILSKRLTGDFLLIRRGLKVNQKFITQICRNSQNPFVEMQSGKRFQISRRQLAILKTI